MGENNLNNKKEILSKIELLETELKALKRSLNNKTVSAPKPFEKIFNDAQKTVSDYFSSIKFNPSEGSIEIDDERFILIRASALSHDFFNNIKNLYKEKSEQEAYSIASDFLFDIGYLIGKEDAEKFHHKLDLKDPIEKLSVGPIYFSHTGWAFVEISEESNPTPDENFFLKYKHPYSFEADAWLKAGKKSKEPVCVMNAAYSSGWCSQSFGISLTAVEVTCKAKGDKDCTFIMAQPHKIKQFLDLEVSKKRIKKAPQIPFFFERKEIESKIKQQEFLLKSTQMLSKIGSWEYSLENNDLTWSDELFNIFEIDADTSSEKLYETYISRINIDDLDELSRCTESGKLGNKYTIQHGITTPSKKKKWIFGTGVPIKDDKGKVIKLMGYAQDITNSVTTEIELNKFFNLSQDMLCVANFDGEFVKVSRSWENSLGFLSTDLVGQKFMSFIHTDDIQKTNEAFSDLKKGKNVIGFENRYKTINDDYRTLNWNSAPDNNTGLIYCIVRDVTLERASELELNKALHEKEILLKEVHHRVKNNMQIISSLLNLQSSFIEDNFILNLFKESQNRIKSIGGIHELLYQSKNLGQIKFEDYLKKLVPDLIYSYYGDQSNIQIKINADFNFNIDTSIPLGLLINEIISNSLKHGLSNSKNDIILIDIVKIENQNYEMRISDNGIGFITPDDKEELKSLGLMLIDELTVQLNGVLTKTKPKKGTEYKIIFSEN